MPPSQEIIVDCQPLSSQAIASSSGAGRVIEGWSDQNDVPAAAASAAFTCAIDAPVPLYVGQEGVAVGVGEPSSAVVVTVTVSPVTGVAVGGKGVGVAGGGCGGGGSGIVVVGLGFGV